MAPTELTLVVQEDGASSEELAAMRAALLLELRELELERAEPLAAGEAPSGAKAAGEALTMAAIAIGVMPSVLPKFIEFLEHWALRSANRTIKVKLSQGSGSIELELPADGKSRDEVERLLDVAQSHLTRPASPTRAN